jgi:cytochrome c oxidase cbb3-type subunit 2
VDASKTPKKLKALQRLGVPYTDADIESAAAETEGVTEIDALVAYLQHLGTVVTGR